MAMIRKRRGWSVMYQKKTQPCQEEKTRPARKGKHKPARKERGKPARKGRGISESGTSVWCVV